MQAPCSKLLAPCSPGCHYLWRSRRPPCRLLAQSSLLLALPAAIIYGDLVGLHAGSLLKAPCSLLSRLPLFMEISSASMQAPCSKLLAPCSPGCHYLWRSRRPPC